MTTPPFLDQLRALLPQVTPVKIPDCLRRPEFKFCRCGYTQSGLTFETAKCKADNEAEDVLKKFKKPVGKGWQDRGYSYNDGDLIEWLAGGGNYGIIAGTEWEVGSGPGKARLFILDADDATAWKDAGFFDGLPERTLTVQSSAPGKLHFYYLTDLESTKAHEELPGFGHLKFRASQCVGPGSLHPSGLRYTLIDGSPPAYVDAETLKAAILRAAGALMPDRLVAVKDMFVVKPDHAARLDANANKLEETARRAKLDRIQRMRDDEKSGPGGSTEVPDGTGEACHDSQATLIGRINGDERVNPCIRRLNAALPENHRFEAMVGINGKPGEGEHFLRRAWAVALIKSGYSDAEIHQMAASFDDHVTARTQQQLESIRAWIEEKGGNYYPCSALRGYIPPEICSGCNWHPPGDEDEEIPQDGSEDSTLPDGVQRWTDDLPPGIPGVDRDGIAYHKVKRSGKNEETKFVKTPICDGYAFISEETRDRTTGEASFTVQGAGSRDSHTFRFDIAGRDFSDPRKLRAALVAHFGARNLVKDLDGEAIQQLTKVVKQMTLIDRPVWIDGRLAIPGVDEDGFKFRIPDRVPVDLTTGEEEAGLRALDLMFRAWPAEKAAVMVTTALSAPVTARWFPGDRFGLAMVGTSGRGYKTEMLKMLTAIYGSGFLSDKSLLKWAEGATVNAMLAIASACGCAPCGVDNYKPTHKDGPGKFVAFVHAVLEGRERERLNRNAELRDTREFATTLIITGEDIPEEASTMARLIPVEWAVPPDLDKLTELQAIADNLPAVGRLWCRYLARPDLKIDLGAWTARRQALVNAAREAESINPGRIGTTAAILRLVWEMALSSPLGEVLRPYTPAFERGLANLIRDTSAATREATEGAQFVEILRELITSGRCIIKDRIYTFEDLSLPNVIGWRLRDPDPHAGGIAILPSLAIEAVRRVMGPQGQSVGSKALYRQLDEMGAIANEDGRRAVVKRIGSKTARVLVFKPGVLMDEDDLMDVVDLSKAAEYAAEDTALRQALQVLDKRLVEAVKIN